MKSVVGRSCRSTLARFKSLGRRKRVLSADSDAIYERRVSLSRERDGRQKLTEKEREGVADNPALESRSPDGSEENDTDEHDDGVLNESELACGGEGGQQEAEIGRASCRERVS